MPEKRTGKVIESYYGKSLVQSGNHFFIIKQEMKPGTEVSFNREDGIEMPSLMFAMAAMNESDLDKTFDFIKDNWFNDYFRSDI